MTRVVLAAPVPVVAVVDGVCVGGALEFAASCDLRLCTDRVRLLTPEVGIGLVASNAGTLLLPEVLGETAARELLLSGEERDAAWAREHGFATEIVAPAELDARIEHWAEVFSRNVARRRGGDEGDAERALRRAAAGRDGARDAPLRAAVRRAGRAGGAERVRRSLSRFHLIRVMAAASGTGELAVDEATAQPDAGPRCVRGHGHVGRCMRGQ